MTYPETMRVRKLMKMRFFTIKIYHPNITHTKNHIWDINKLDPKTNKVVSHMTDIQNNL